MEFLQYPKPIPEEMVEYYVQTLAKVVGSVEEAKKRMYACSATTYVGFQAVMTEEMSEKFQGLPGVLFILPDSYIDPENKEYGGDRYINGTIIPRPPPVRYEGLQRSRNYDQPRYNRQREPMPMQQGNQPYDRQRDPMPMQQGNPPYDRHRDPMPKKQGNHPYDLQRQRDPMPMQPGNPPYDLPQTHGKKKKILSEMFFFQSKHGT
ncbi:DAG protein, chloroplastic-like [Tasmannia lanceolata]|uniref:DAG protein, chloroplastic-like n=1 Tax=Tasmannia lanceolata TaxID=3420 RepID=UPI0040629236